MSSLHSVTLRANIAFEHRYTEGKLDRLPALADELVRLKVDLILTATIPGARAAKKATKTIPIVFWTEGDPVVDGLVDGRRGLGEISRGSPPFRR